MIAWWVAAIILAGGQAPGPPAGSPGQPSVKVGTVIFADYTFVEAPKIVDVNGDRVSLDQFNIGRVYLNVTGTLSPRISFRVTPEVTRATGSGTSVNGSYVARLKFAYVQWNLDARLPRGSFVRVGMQPTLWNEFIEPVYRYRFQGQLLEDREGFLPTADLGASFRYPFAGAYGDVEAGVFNGEGYSHPEVNGGKAVTVRASLRPWPGRAALRGLRLTGFVDRDEYAADAPRRRAIAALTFEDPRVTAGFYELLATDRTARDATSVDSHGWTAWVNPRLAKGWELLARLERLTAEPSAAGRKLRTIDGVAYTVSHTGIYIGRAHGGPRTDDLVRRSDPSTCRPALRSSCPSGFLTRHG